MPHAQVALREGLVPYLKYKRPLNKQVRDFASYPGVVEAFRAIARETKEDRNKRQVLEDVHAQQPVDIDDCLAKGAVTKWGLHHLNHCKDVEQALLVCGRLCESGFIKPKALHTQVQLRCKAEFREMITSSKISTAAKYPGEVPCGPGRRRRNQNDYDAKVRKCVNEMQAAETIKDMNVRKMERDRLAQVYYKLCRVYKSKTHEFFALICCRVCFHIDIF